jgi:hypothetical protein
MIMWNRLRYTIWAPAYDALVGAVGSPPLVACRLTD